MLRYRPQPTGSFRKSAPCGLARRLLLRTAAALALLAVPSLTAAQSATPASTVATQAAASPHAGEPLGSERPRARSFDDLPASDRQFHLAMPSIELALRDPLTLRWTQPAHLVDARFFPTPTPAPLVDPGELLARVERTADRLSERLKLFGGSPANAPPARLPRPSAVPRPTSRPDLQATLVPGWFHGPAAHIEVDF